MRFQALAFVQITLCFNPQVGVGALVIAYTIVGALIFQAIEADPSAVDGQGMNVTSHQIAGQGMEWTKKGDQPNNARQRYFNTNVRFIIFYKI